MYQLSRGLNSQGVEWDALGIGMIAAALYSLRPNKSMYDMCVSQIFFKFDYICKKYK